MSFQPASPSLIAAHTFGLAILALILQGFLSFNSITDALAFYGVYHRDPMNQIIHFFGVPIIIWSMLVFLAHLNVPLLTRMSSSLSSSSSSSLAKNNKIKNKNRLKQPLLMIHLPGTDPHRLTYAAIVSLIYIAFYLYLDPFGGALYAPFAYGMYVTAINVTMKDQSLAIKNVKGSHASGKFDTTTTPPRSWVGTGKALKMAAILNVLGWYVQIHPGHGIYEGAKPAVLQSVGGALTSAPLFAYYEGLWYMGLNKGLKDETKLLVDKYSIDLCKQGARMRACSDYDFSS